MSNEHLMTTLRNLDQMTARAAKRLDVERATDEEWAQFHRLNDMREYEMVYQIYLLASQEGREQAYN